MSLRKITVREHMSATPMLLTPDIDILHAMSQLIESHQSAAAVVDEHGNLIGILSEKDCMKVALHAGYYEEAAGRVANYMTTTVESVNADMTIMELAAAFMEKPYRLYPVLDDAEVVGQITRHDVLKALQKVW
jgi:predicted transcriptional regulator